MIVLFVPAMFILTTIWFSFAFPRLITFTEILAQWCESIFFLCLDYFLIIKTFFLWFGFIVLSVCLAYAVFKAFFRLLITCRQINKLPLSCHGNITIIKDDNLKTAFTHGLLQPNIYISSGLINSLDNFELNAVYLHELHHKKRKDPLRFFILSILRDTFFYIPIKGFIERVVYTRVEAEADDAAVSKMLEPISLASALLKVARFNNPPLYLQQGWEWVGEGKEMLMFQPASIKGIGSIENRIKRLIEGKVEKVKLPSVKEIISSIVISGFILLSLAFPLFAFFPDIGGCDTNYCDIHKNKLGEDCEKHCELSNHYTKGVHKH